MVSQPNSLAGRDVATVIHPYTNLEQHNTVGPTVISRGREGMAGLWSTSLGFGEKRLVEAAIRQMGKLPTYHIFNGRSNEPMIELAEALLRIAPTGLGKVLFANSGSEANDQAAKIVWFYNNAIGRPRKKKIISRVRAYHGITVFSGSLTGLQPNHNDFDLPVGGVLRADCPSHYLFRLPRRERERLCRSAGRQSRTNDHSGRTRHYRGVHRGAGERRGRCDRAAARLLSPRAGIVAPL
jgi:4-aminobutyrate--pyruvate transaminase